MITKRSLVINILRIFARGDMNLLPLEPESVWHRVHKALV
jgi:hypothetical protein